MHNQRLQHLAQLPENWDSYGAQPPNTTAIRWSQEALRILATLGFEPTGMVPSAENGIGIVFLDGEKYADIEFFNTGEILVGMSIGQNDPVILEVSPDTAGIEDALQQIRTFLQE